MTKEYEGKFFSLLGDSISTLAGYNPPECAVFYDWQNKRQAEIRGPEDTWWGYVLEALGGQLLVNHSWSGSLVSKHAQCQIESYGCSDSRTAALEAEGQVPDVILILMGLNDFGWGVGPEAFAVAYETMLLKLRCRYPQAEIWCMTLPISRWSKNPDFVAPTCRAGWRLQNYNSAIRICAEAQACRVLDVFCPDKPYDTIDGYHPNAQGMQTLARSVLDQL